MNVDDKIKISWAKENLKEFNKRKEVYPIDAQLALSVQHLLEIIEKDKWQPIETAPKDGSRLLLLVPPYGASTGHYANKWHCHSVLNKEAHPTHWMPLPQPPTGTKDKCDKCQEEKQVNFRINNYKLCDECVDKEFEND